MASPRRKNRRGRRRRGANNGAGSSFNPPSIPPTIQAPAPLRTWVEVEETVNEGSFNATTIKTLTDRIGELYGFNPSSSTATTSFCIQLHRVAMWLIPNTNDTAFGELTVQHFAVPLGGNQVLRQTQGYGSRDRAARVGYVYPSAIQQMPISDTSVANWFRAKHDHRSAGDMTLLVRALVTILPFGGDVEPTTPTYSNC